MKHTCSRYSLVIAGGGALAGVVEVGGRSGESNDGRFGAKSSVVLRDCRQVLTRDRQLRTCQLSPASLASSSSSILILRLALT